MGFYTEIVREIKNRLIANLEGCTVAVGFVDERLTQDQERFCVLLPTNIDEAYGRARQENRKDATINFTLSCMKAIEVDNKENLYQLEYITDGEGTQIVDEASFQLVSGSFLDSLFPFIEEVLDALNTETDGTTLNPQLVNSTESMGLSISNFQATSDRVWFDVNITVRTVPFLINNRQNI